MSEATADRGACPVLASPAPQDSYRILLLRKTGPELLVTGERPPFTLPRVEIPRWERVAENMNAVVRKRYGISPVCLFTPDLPVAATDSERPLYQVMETRKASVEAPEGAHWLPVDSFSEQSFTSAQDSCALTSASRQIHEFDSGKIIGPFGKPGWIEELSSWVQHAIDPRGLRLNGEFRQLNASPTFALLRLETNGPAVWFKAVGEPNLREFPISVTLSRLCPGFVPTVIATHPAWHGWLTTEFPGSPLDEVPDACAWVLAAQTLGALQIASVGKTDQLLEAGCRDLRITSLLTLVDPFMEVMSHLMEQQQTTSPPTLSTTELLSLGKQIKNALSDLAELNIPDALGHLDFNPGNILCSADQCVVLDWAEAYVGPPFLTFEFLRVHLHRIRTEDKEPTSETLSGCYGNVWSSVLSSKAIADGQKLARLLAVFSYAAGTQQWREPGSVSMQRIAAYFRSLTRRMQREAEL